MRPLYSYRCCRAAPRLDRHTGKSRCSSGVFDTASLRISKHCSRKQNSLVVLYYITPNTLALKEKGSFYFFLIFSVYLRIQDHAPLKESFWAKMNIGTKRQGKCFIYMCEAEHRYDPGVSILEPQFADILSKSGTEGMIYRSSTSHSTQSASRGPSWSRLVKLALSEVIHNSLPRRASFCLAR